MKVTVFGTGYVGLVQGAVLAEVGHHVVCVDLDQDKINQLKNGIVSIYEPGLTSLVNKNTNEKRLIFTTDTEYAVSHGDIIFIAVGTPPNEDGSADLSHVLDVAETISLHMNRYKVIVNKSTIPVGSGEKIKEKIHNSLIKNNKNFAFDVVSNPEFLKEGSAISDCMRPDRIIIGTDSKVAEELIRELYYPFNRNHEKMIVMDIRSAELTKYAANCMLATKISFMNEIASISEAMGADIEMIRQGIGSDPRIGYHFIYAGAGFGGSCFPKDIKALIHTARENGINSDILNAVQERNDTQKHLLFEKIHKHFNYNLSGKTVSLWGLSFKPNTNDIREAPSLILMELLWDAGANIKAYDPEAMKEIQKHYGNRLDLTLCDKKEETLAGADCLAIMTEWPEFKAPDFELIREKLTQPVIFDGRNLYSPVLMKQKGIVYYSVGRQPTK